ncbi:hypothetical protein VTP01DRAFT_7864 [Rhizomucor pusillus]|uniref:uncharacterized protein n=1 Tax=Rhizomucor pusillus TaxID=4840 RepID=UPI0037427776
MALLLLLPNEILWSIMRYLKPHAGISLLRSCRTLHELTKDEKFWREYARYHCITYRDPTRLWYTLYATGDLFKMCSHIDYLQLLESLPRKRQVFWQLLADFRNRLSCCCSRARLDGESALCMAPDCDFVGCGEATFSFDDSNLGHMKEHWEKTNHSITLKLSPFNFLEMWCYACRMPLGFWGFPSMTKSKDERYIVRQIVGYLTQLPDHDRELRSQVLEHRRWTERRLLSSQEIVDDVNIVEKRWFMKWLDFIIDTSNHLPGIVPNDLLFNQQDGALRTDIRYGEDFVLVSGPIRSYLERTYGVRGKIVAGCELAGKEHYQSIYKSIFARRDVFLSGPPLPIMNHH